MRYCRLCAVKEAKEHGASVLSEPIDLLCGLLGQAAHHPLTTTHKHTHTHNIRTIPISIKVRE